MEDPGVARKSSIRVNTLEFREADFCLFTGHIGRILSVAIPKCENSQRSWFMLKDKLLKHEKTPSQYAGSQTDEEEDQVAAAGSPD